jgi:hypothetical protein
MSSNHHHIHNSTCHPEYPHRVKRSKVKPQHLSKYAGMSKIKSQNSK